MCNDLTFTVFLCISHCAGVVKVRAATPDGTVRERFQKTGFRELALRVKLGKDLLPSTLHDGVVLLAVDGELTVWKRDLDLQQQAYACLDYPGRGLLELLDKRQRKPRTADANNQELDEEETMDVVSRAMYRLGSCPFPYTADVYLLDILEKVGLLVGQQITVYMHGCINIT